MQGSLDLLVLKVLSRQPKLHGYAIMTAIKHISGDVLNAEVGSLYPALHRMGDRLDPCRMGRQRHRPPHSPLPAHRSRQKTA